jgi:hypothetical protein
MDLVMKRLRIELILKGKQMVLIVCEDFLHTLPHEDMHSQNSFGGGTTM